MSKIKNALITAGIEAIEKLLKEGFTLEEIVEEINFCNMGMTSLYHYGEKQKEDKRKAINKLIHSYYFKASASRKYTKESLHDIFETYKFSK